MAGAGAAGDMQLLRLTEENTALKEALLEAQQGGAAAESPVPGVVAFALDDAGVLTAWGPEAERLFARSAKDIVGRELSAAMALTNAAEVPPPLSRQPPRLTHSRQHSRIDGPKLAERWVSIRVNAIAENPPPPSIEALTIAAARGGR